MNFKVEVRAYKVLDVEASDYMEAERIVRKAFDLVTRRRGGQQPWELEDVTAIDCDEEVEEDLEEC